MHKLLLAISLTACTPDPISSPSATVAPIAPLAAPIAPPLLGVVAARASEVVAARVDGRIVRVIAKSGQRVHTGDLIAELDPTLLAERLRGATAAVDAARAEIAGASAEVTEARRQVTLAGRLLAVGVGPHESVQAAHTSLARAIASSSRAAAAFREAGASRAAIESQLAYTRFEAPIDGVVSLIKAQTGEVVAPGAVIARVFDPASLMIRFQVPRDRRRELSTGTVVELTVAGAARPLRARVTSVSSDLEPPLDFAVAEADIDDAAAAREIQIGTLGDVRVVGPG
jgi:RND family efflux transporter MFP subunit